MSDLKKACRDIISASDEANTAAIHSFLGTPYLLEQAFDESITIGHVLGFYQLRLGEHDGRLVRIHLWKTTSLTGGDEDGDIHSHLWGFRSHLLSGSLGSRTYDVDFSPSRTGAVYEVRYRRDSTERRRLHLGADWTTREMRSYERGEAYNIDKNDFHTSYVTDVDSLTVLITNERSGHPPIVVREADRPSTTFYPHRHLSKDEKRRFFDVISTILKDKA